MYPQKINRQKEIFGWYICVFQTFDGCNKMDIDVYIYLWRKKHPNNFKHLEKGDLCKLGKI
jgi:hypothetical protein